MSWGNTPRYIILFIHEECKLIIDLDGSGHLAIRKCLRVLYTVGFNPEPYVSGPVAARMLAFGNYVTELEPSAIVV